MARPVRSLAGILPGMLPGILLESPARRLSGFTIDTRLPLQAAVNGRPFVPTGTFSFTCVMIAAKSPHHARREDCSCNPRCPPETHRAAPKRGLAGAGVYLEQISLVGKGRERPSGCARGGVI